MAESLINELLEGFNPVDQRQSVSQQTQLLEKLKILLKDRRIRKDMRFPSIRQICRCFGVGQVTAQQVFGELAKSGLIRKDHGKGCFINTVSGRITRDPCRQISLPLLKLPAGVDFGSPIANMLSGLCLSLSRNGWNVNIEEARKDGNEFYHICDKYRNLTSDGLVLFGEIEGMETKLREADLIQLPVVMANSESRLTCCVIADIFDACRTMTQNFIDQGMERFGILSTEASRYRFSEIEKGIDVSLQRGGFKRFPQYIKYYDTFDMAQMKNDVIKMLVSDKPPEVLYCSPEMRTIAALEAVRETGRKVEIVSIDDSYELSLWANQKIYQIKVPYFDIGRETGRILIESIKTGKELKRKVIRIPCSIFS